MGIALVFFGGRLERFDVLELEFLAPLTEAVLPGSSKSSSGLLQEQ